MESPRQGLKFFCSLFVLAASLQPIRPVGCCPGANPIRPTNPNKGQTMESGLRWHGFTIYHDGIQFVAQVDKGDDPILEIGSQSVDRLIAMIDEFKHYNDHLASGDSGHARAPSWLRDWYENLHRIMLSEDMGVFTGDLIIARVDADKVFAMQPDKLHDKDEQAKLLRKRWQEFENLVSLFMQDKPVKFQFDLSKRPEVQIIDYKEFFDLKNYGSFAAASARLFSHSRGGLLIKSISKG